MIKILPEVEDVGNIRKIREVIKEINGDTEGEFYRVEYKGAVSYLHRLGFLYTLLAFEGDFISYEQFTIDKDYLIQSIFLNQHIVYLDKDVLFFQTEDGLLLSLKVWKIEGNTDDMHNGYLSFSQYNVNKKESVVVTYPCSCKEGDSNKVNALSNDKPVELFFQKYRVFQKKYQLREKECGSLFYSLVAIKDYGLKNFLKKGSYSLIRSNYVSGYIRSFGSCTSFSFYPFCQMYQEEEMYAMLKEKGFLIEIPEEVLSFYNEFTPEAISDYYAILNAFKEIDKEGNIFLAFIKKD